MARENYSALSDDRLAALTAGGDEAAFEEIVIRYVKLIYSVAAEYYTGGYEPSDFVQEGLLAFLAACKSYDGTTASFKNYAVKCARNRFSDIVKKGRVQSAVPECQLVSMENLKHDIDPAQNVEDYIEEREHLKNLFDSIHKSLSEEENNVFNLYLHGYSYSEIASEIGRDNKYVDNMLQRIKRKIRKNQI